MQRKYYNAYDERYKQIHEKSLQWFGDEATPIVQEVIEELNLSFTHRILEIGCGEGRDAFALLRRGFDLLATDVSFEAINYCRKKAPEFAENFQVLDCVTQELNSKFDFIFAVAVVHMLVPDEDRAAFYRFIRKHLTQNGAALICTMGDGIFEIQSDIGTAFELKERIHEATGTAVQIAGTSCRMVSFQTFENELSQNGLAIIKKGITAVEPDFPQMMFALVRKEQNEDFFTII